jgi:hypothetical protein
MYVYSCNRIIFFQGMNYTVKAVTTLWPFDQTFSKYSSPELRNFLRHLPENWHLKYSCINNRRCSRVYLSRGLLLHQRRAAMYLLAAHLITHSASVSSTAKVTLSFENSAKGLTWPPNQAPPLAPTFPWLNTLWVLFAGKLKRNSVLKNPLNLEQLKNNNHREISTVSRQEFQRVNKVFCRYTDWIRSIQHIFSNCCRACDVLFDFLKVIIRGNLYLASFTDC